MSLKKPHTLKSLNDKEAPLANQNWDRLYATRIESLKKYVGSASAVIPFAYQEMLLGEVTFSANGSATVAKTIAIGPFQDVLYATAHARSILVDAKVTDLTATSITIEAVTRNSSTALFSGVTTATITTWFQVIGSSP